MGKKENYLKKKIKLDYQVEAGERGLAFVGRKILELGEDLEQKTKEMETKGPPQELKSRIRSIKLELGAYEEVCKHVQEALRKAKLKKEAVVLSERKWKAKQIAKRKKIEKELGRKIHRKGRGA